MEPMKNLCGLIPESLHKRLMEGKDPEMTNGEYLTKVLTAYLDQPTTAKQEQRTLAVQISEDMFQQLKSYRRNKRTQRHGSGRSHWHTYPGSPAGNCHRITVQRRRLWVLCDD